MFGSAQKQIPGFFSITKVGKTHYYIVYLCNMHHGFVYVFYALFYDYQKVGI